MKCPQKFMLNFWGHSTMLLISNRLILVYWNRDFHVLSVPDNLKQDTVPLVQCFFLFRCKIRFAYGIACEKIVSKFLITNRVFIFLIVCLGVFDI